MNRIDIPFNELNMNVLKAWEKDWFLLTSGDMETGNFNTMTVAWGSLGVMWNKPIVVVVVRPQRHTLKLLNNHDSFTLTAFPDEYRKALSYCGAHSGADVDKMEATGLTPIASKTVDSPGFDEAQLIIECKIIYRDQYRAENCMADYIPACYEANDWHHFFYGEITGINGTEDYRKA